MDKRIASPGRSSTTDPSRTSTHAHAEVRFTLPRLLGTHLVQMGPSTVIRADELLAAMERLIPAEFAPGRSSNGHA